MATIEAYSSITAYDLSDVGQLYSFLTSSQPITMVHNPNNNSYIPNWSITNLEIVPTISYNGNQLSLLSTGLSIAYKRKEGSGEEEDLTSGEIVSDGVLTVSSNKLAEAENGILTYICTIRYTDPKTQIPITLKNSLTYSLISSGSDIKHAYISGESTFLYDSFRNIVGNGIIQLYADVQNVNIDKWQYLDSSGVYADYPKTYNDYITRDTLEVYANESDIWNDGRIATIKLLTTDANVFDIFQIRKLYDGADGSSTVSVVLTNKSHYVPCDEFGEVISWNGSPTSIYIYEGGKDVTFEEVDLCDEDDVLLQDESGATLTNYSWDIVCNLGNGLTGTFYNGTFTPTALAEDTSYADFICHKDGYSDITIRYTITKTRSGADGVSPTIYELVSSAYAINLNNETGVFQPASVTFNAYTKSGDRLMREAYRGRFMIYESEDGGNTKTFKWRSDVNESSTSYVPSSKYVDIITCELYAAGGFNDLLDEQTVVIARDGVNGDGGVPGLSVGIVNTQDIIACNENGYTSETKLIAIPYYAYLGIERIPVNAQIVGSLPEGMTLISNASGTTEADGNLILRVDDNKNLGNADSGTITLELACGEECLTDENDVQLTDENGTVLKDISGIASITRTYTWTKNLRGANGTSASICQIYVEGSNAIKKLTDTVELKLRYMYGGEVVTPSSIQWYKFQNGSYLAIPNATSASLNVTAEMIDDMAFFKCSATYGGITCEDYYTVDDAQDLISAEVFSTVREFKNGEGCGAVYTRLYKANGEIDPLYSNDFSVIEPTNPSDGDYYYHLDVDEQTVTLKQYNSATHTWSDATETYDYTYKYYRVDKNGKPMDTSAPYKSTRCVYVDPSIIGDVMQFICEVSE